MGLTDLGIERIKPPKNREKYQADRDGLYIKITPKGKKSWRHYGKTRKWHKLGNYPDLSLKEARAKNEGFKILTDKGLNPEEMDLPSSNPTVKEFFNRWYSEAVDKKGNAWSDAYKRNVKYIFDADVLPFIGKIKVRDINKSTIAHVIKKILDRNASGHARHVYLRLKRLFNYAAELDIIQISPMSTMPPKGTSSQKDRVLSATELKTFLSHLYQINMEDSTAKLLELILRTGQRPGECLGIHRDEVEGHWWTLSGEKKRTKNRIAHRVYLTDDVLELIGKPAPSGYYLESTVTSKPIMRNSISNGLRRSLNRKNSTPSLPLEPFTPHDLRRTCATHLAGLGFSDDVIGAVLNHKKRTVTGIYNRHGYDKEKQSAMEAWGGKIENIISEKQKDNVLPFIKNEIQ